MASAAPAMTRMTWFPAVSRFSVVEIRASSVSMPVDATDTRRPSTFTDVPGPMPAGMCSSTRPASGSTVALKSVEEKPRAEMTAEALVSTAGLRSMGMISSTVVPETIENVIAPTGSACPVRMTVDGVLDTLNVACAQAVGLPARTLTANNRTRVHRRILGMDTASSAGGPPSGTASRIGGWWWFLRWGAGFEWIAPDPARLGHPCPADTGPVLPDLPWKRPERREQVQADPGGSPGLVRQKLDLPHFRIQERWLRVLQKIRPVFRTEQLRRGFPVARGEQTPVRLGPRSQHLSGRRVGLGGAALGPGDVRAPKPQGQGHTAHADEAFHRCSLSHNAPESGKNTTGEERAAPPLHGIFTISDPELQDHYLGGRTVPVTENPAKSEMNTLASPPVKSVVMVR